MACRQRRQAILCVLLLDISPVQEQEPTQHFSDAKPRPELKGSWRIITSPFSWHWSPHGFQPQFLVHQSRPHHMVWMSDHDNPLPSFSIAKVFLEFRYFISVPGRGGETAAVWVFTDVNILNVRVGQSHLFLNQKGQVVLF